MEISKNESKEKKERPRNLWKDTNENKYQVKAIIFIINNQSIASGDGHQW